MLLKSIKLENFRQFRNESINFAQGENGKNVTIIIGENGTGKTTFAQAFFWCMYGETEFSDKIMLNKMVASEMTPDSEEKVRVTLTLRHGEVDYTLIREQAYHKDYSNNVKGDNTVFDIAVKDASGNTSFVKKSQCEAEVKSILPKELSRYFFFDGERIEKMSKDISTGKKATDFAEAVKGLLGLNAMISAIGHFNPRSSLGVIGSYEKSFDSKSNKKIQEYQGKNVSFRSIQFHKTVVSKYEKNGSVATITFGSSLQYQLYIDGAFQKKVQDRFRIQYIYIIDSSKLDKYSKVIGIRCPSCGSGAIDFKTHQCKYCGTYMKDIVKRVWYCNDLVSY